MEGDTKTCPCNRYPTFTTRVCRGLPVFLNFASKHVLSKKEKYKTFSADFFFDFLKLKKSLFIAWASFRNSGVSPEDQSYDLWLILI